MYWKSEGHRANGDSETKPPVMPLHPSDTQPLSLTSRGELNDPNVLLFYFLSAVSYITVEAELYCTGEIKERDPHCADQSRIADTGTRLHHQSQDDKQTVVGPEMFSLAQLSEAITVTLGLS